MTTKLDLDIVDDQKVENIHTEDLQIEPRSDFAGLTLVKSISTFRRLFLTGVAASLGAT
jgi:hypothetical protein